MPSLKRRRRAYRREWTGAHFLQLRAGWDFFSDAWSDPTRLSRLVPIDQQHEAKAWPRPEVLDDMRSCWEIHRERLLAEYATRRPLWAELVFDQGMAPQEALTHDTGGDD